MPPYEGPAPREVFDGAHALYLLDGDVDALFHAIEPRAFAEGHPKVKRLFDDPRTTERAYFKKTGIFPIFPPL